jgi:hypothetical protein
MAVGPDVAVATTGGGTAVSTAVVGRVVEMMGLAVGETAVSHPTMPSKIKRRINNFARIGKSYWQTAAVQNKERIR